MNRKLFSWNILISVLLLACSTTLSAQEVGDTWKELDKKGNELFMEAEYEKCLEVFLKSLAAAKKEFGTSHANYSTALYNVGIALLYTGNYDESEKSLLAAASVFANISGKNSAEYKSYLDGIVFFYSSIGDSLKVLPHLEESLEITKLLKGNRNPEYLLALINLSDRYLDVGMTKKAETLLLEGRGLATGQEKLSGDFCTRLFQLYASQNNGEKAEPFFQEAKRIRNKIQEEFWKTLDLKKMAYSYQVDDQDSRLNYWTDQVKELKESDGESMEYAQALFNLSLIYQTQEEYTLAEGILMEAKNVIETNEITNGYSTLYNSLAYFHDNMGNFPQAKLYYEKELTSARAVGGRDHINYGTSCANLSIFHLNHGDIQKGELLAKEALLIFAGLQEGYTYYAGSCMGLALFFEKQGKTQKVEAYQKEAAKIYNMAFGENHYISARIALNLGLTYEKQNKIAQAEALIVQSKNVHEKTFGKDHIQYAGFSYELARFYVRQKQYARAAPFFQEAASIKLKRVRDNFGNLSEKEKKDLYRNGVFYFENYAFCLLKLAQTDKTAAGDLYNLIIDTKGLIYRSSMQTKAKVLSSGNQQLVRLFNDWTAERDNLAKLFAMSLEERKNKGVDLEKIETRVNSLEKNMVRQANQLNIGGFEVAQDVDWPMIKSKLRPNEAAIEIVRATRDGIANETIYAALIVTGAEQTELDLVMLGDGIRLETKSIQYYHNAIQLQLDDTLSYGVFWEPIAKKLRDVEKVYLSPSGVYHKINPASLRNPSTGKFLIDEWKIQFVGNTKDILNDHGSNPVASSAYFIGFPDYTSGIDESEKNDKRSAGPVFNEVPESQARYFDASSGTVTPLPGTEVEVVAIGDMLKSKNLPVAVWTGKDATEGRLKKINQPTILHIATHGFFLPNQQAAEQDDASKKAKMDPMLRSGLLLADCENSLRGLSSDPEKEDGILTAFEAMSLPLDHTDLVVLSACETGLGDIDNSEGVYGLLRAFQQAGSRFVLVSLWKVDDEATQLLMTEFYRFQLQGLDYGEAFDRARQLVIERYPKPYYWGAFVLIGA